MMLQYFTLFIFIVTCARMMQNALQCFSNGTRGCSYFGARSIMRNEDTTPSDLVRGVNITQAVCSGQ